MFTLRNFLQASFRFSSIAKSYARTDTIKRLIPGLSNFSTTPLIQFSRNLQTPLIKSSPNALPLASNLLQSPPLNTVSTIQQTRSVTKWSLKKGKRKTVKAVVKRFYRLGWDAWIRPMVGRNKRHWSKTAKRKIRAEKHVFCNATQSTMLDKMVTKYWRKRRFYIDDIYEPYHQREEYPASAVKPH